MGEHDTDRCTAGGLRMSQVEAVTGIVGWREWAALPALGVGPVQAKVDTGAQTSALHATHIEQVTLPDGRDGVSFCIYDDHNSDHTTGEIVMPLHDTRFVRNSGGVRNIRMVIFTTLLIGDLRIDAELTLVDRASMRYPMLIGRTSLRAARVLVNSGTSWLRGPVPGYGEGEAG